ncbi:centrosomal protein of 89 kDa-like isoform X2 [Xyrauchen texanus]|uniref:centrosomal protein of 89 kDa-like isoform X2 n=1 Tax=Xyrauchen texanus TaxID=154827 RepID=UPI0022421163|nr:centrosomal protein of 89 kDa-like isoform X2 [Xyrauchen texanus]
MSSRFNFSLRRREKKEFMNIAHGLIPAATIAPRPAVPRTPPPCSPDPSSERPRSALAAAILSSSLMGRTVAIPPPRQRSYSESDCSRSDSQTGIEPYTATALYTRDRWTDSMARRPPVPSPGHTDDDDNDEVEGLERDENHVYQSLERQQSRADDINVVYAVPLKHRKGLTSSDADEDTEDSAFDIVSPLQTEEEIVIEEGAAQTPSSLRQPRSISHESMASPDLNDDMSAPSHKSALQTPKRKTSRRKECPVRGKERDISSVSVVCFPFCVLPCPVCCVWLCGAEASEMLCCALEVQQELVKDLREQTQVLAREKEMLEKRCLQQSQHIEHLQQELSHSHTERGNATGESSELQSLRQQAQELVDENDGLKMTVHRLNVELSRYQTRFRPLSKDENAQLKGLPMKGPALPWLLDMKYLSPLLLAYEDQLNARDDLLKSCEEEMQSLRVRAEEVIQENEKLHAQVNKSSAVSNKEWRQLQEQARLVLEENRVFIEQLELQHAKAKEAHSRHTQEVCKVTKQVMLLESDKQALEKELEVEHKEHHALKNEFQRVRLALQNSLSLAEHNNVTDKFKRQLQELEKVKNSEVEELLSRVSAMEAEKKTLLLVKTNLNTDIKHIETELQLSRQANRKAQRRIHFLKQQVEDSLEKELVAHQYLANIVTLAEKTTHERDQLMHMASSLEKDKQGVLTRIIESTVCLGKLQEKVKVYKQQASASVYALGLRLREQEEDFSGKAASYQREIRHLQSQLKDRQEQLHGALQQKREVEGELEVVWEAATKESQRLREVGLGNSSLNPATMAPVLRSTSGHSSARICVEDHLSSVMPPPFTSRQSHPLIHSPMFESDSDQHQNPSSDESEKSGWDLLS